MLQLQIGCRRGRVQVSAWTAKEYLSHTFHDQIPEGDEVTLRMTFRGTHQEQFQGIPPTGKEVAFEAIVVDALSTARW